VPVRRTHHGNLDAHVAQSGDSVCPASFNWSTSLELETKFGEEFNGGIEVLHHDTDVVHALDRHDPALPGESATGLQLSELGCRARQQPPFVALLLPVHQDGEILRRLLAVGEFLFADKVEAYDR